MKYNQWPGLSTMQKKVAVAELGERFRVVFDEATAQRLLKQSDEEVLSRFDEVRARIGERTAGFSEEEIAADVAAARAELPD